jgi:hypothetical protein
MLRPTRHGLKLKLLGLHLNENRNDESWPTFDIQRVQKPKFGGEAASSYEDMTPSIGFLKANEHCSLLLMRIDGAFFIVRTP